MSLRGLRLCSRSHDPSGKGFKPLLPPKPSQTCESYDACKTSGSLYIYKTFHGIKKLLTILLGAKSFVTVLKGPFLGEMHSEILVRNKQMFETCF